MDWYVLSETNDYNPTDDPSPWVECPYCPGDDPRCIYCGGTNRLPANPNDEPNPEDAN